MSKVFLDTNLVVYANDETEPEKQLRAAHLVAELGRAQRGVISTQVMQEYAYTGLRKLQQEPAVVLQQLLMLERSLEVIQVTPDLVRHAVELQALYQVNFWDACIVAAAETARCDVIYSEDLNAGLFYAGIRLVNPFAAP